MEKGFFAVHVLAGGQRIHYNLFVPVVWNGDHNRVNFLVIEQLL